MADTDRFLEDEVKKYVSNTDKDIYTVSNIPEEVVAVIFAYVSRSPKSFRDNIGTVIQEEQLGQERAAKFHEKWVLNYGHASVAEHAAVHVGIERVSRLFSSILELSNEYLSFTEYSQRYQKPVKGDFYVPSELNSKPKLKKEFENLSNTQYDIYENLNKFLLEHLKKTIPVPEGVKDTTHFRALEKIAFEDARYALNLSTFTNLGMTGNARAIEDSLSILLSNKYEEVRSRAEEIKQEVKFSVPTLVKYANENKYQVETRKALEKSVSEYESLGENKNSSGPETNLLDWTGKDSDNPEFVAIKKIVEATLFEHTNLSSNQIKNKLKNETEHLLKVYEETINRIGKHDNPLNYLKLVKYEAEFTLSEANWHQLLRHRKINWIYKDPSVFNGVTIPPNIQDSNTVDLLLEATNKSELLYEKMINENLENAAHYVVTNAHNRKVFGSFDLWELYHLTNLRMSEGAQWDIKKLTTQLTEQIAKHHPSLVKNALKRVDV